MLWGARCKAAASPPIAYGRPCLKQCRPVLLPQDWGHSTNRHPCSTHLLAAGTLLPALGFALTPSAAAGMMAFSSVAVVSNSLLLRAQFSVDAVDKA